MKANIKYSGKILHFKDLLPILSCKFSQISSLLNIISEVMKIRQRDSEFDMLKYISFYCQQDVKILHLCFNQFIEGFIQDFSIDSFKFLSNSSLANEVFN